MLTHNRLDNLICLKKVQIKYGLKQGNIWIISYVTLETKTSENEMVPDQIGLYFVRQNDT